MKIKNEIPLLTILIIFGISINLHYGRIGYMPLDQSEVFDGGWRIISGQIPFRDFTTPHSIVPIYLQALFFKLFGVNWFAYCLHASVFNALFCIMVFYLLRALDGLKAISFFYALLSGIFFYPPFGVPFADQHSFFFLLLSIFLTVQAKRSEGKKIEVFLWFLIVPVFFLAYLSKQTPAIFGAIPILILILMDMKRDNWRKIIIILSLSALVCFGVLALLIFLYQLDSNLINVYYFKLPLMTGKQRSAELSLGNMLINLFSFDKRFYSVPIVQSTLTLIIATLFISVNFIKLRNPIIQNSSKLFIIFSAIFLLVYGLYKFSFYSYAVSVLILSILFFSRNEKLEKLTIWLSSKMHQEELIANIFLLESLLVICVLFKLVTLNQSDQSYIYLFASIGIFHISSLNLFRNIENQVIKILVPIISVGLVAISIFDAYVFNFRVNSTRIVHDINYEKNTLQKDIQKYLPENLSFMVWAINDHYEFSAQDFGDIVKFFNENSGNFYLLGDSSILYGLTGRPSVSPSIYFTRGLTIPMKETKEFEEYQDRLIQNIKRYDVRFIVLEGKQTWMEERISDYSRLEKIVKDRANLVKTFGGFKIYKIFQGT